MKKNQWEYAEERKQLIAMVERNLNAKRNIGAMNIVDAILLSAWEYADKGKCCESVRPVRKTMCQKRKGHKGSCRAVIFWEAEE